MSRSGLAICVLASCLAALSSGAPGQERESPSAGILADVPHALAGIPAEVKPLTIARGAAAVPRGGHLQGIQLRFDAAHQRHVAFLSHDSETAAYLVIAELPKDWAGDGRVTHVLTFPSDGQSPPLRHAGGIQMLGDVLVVGLEDNQQKTRSEVQFWNVATPEQPVQLEHLTVRRNGAPKDHTAGAVGLVARAKDHVLVVANWDSRAIDCYLSNGKPLADPDCRFALAARWQDATAQKDAWQPNRVFGAYQAVNLAADADDRIFLFGFYTTPAGQDLVDLYALNLEQEPAALLTKLSIRPLQLPGKNHFQSAGGIWMDQGRLGILSGPHVLEAELIIGVARE